MQPPRRPRASSRALALFLSAAALAGLTSVLAPRVASAARTIPVEPAPFGNVRSVSGGGTYGGDGSHTVAVRNDGSVWVWGDGIFGQLGDGTTSPSSVPVLVETISNVVAASAGGFHTIALKSDGTVWGWGSTRYGQLGIEDPTAVQRTRPVRVQGLSNVVAVSAGGTHNLALKSDGTVWAWGTNNNGQAGDGTVSEFVYAPVRVQGLSNVKAVSAGNGYSLAVTQDGTLWGWGSNYGGINGLDGPSSGIVLGLPPDTFSTSTPVQVAGATGLASVSAGGGHVVALKTDGTVLTWGSNLFGQLGDGGGAAGGTPRVVPGLSNVTAVSAGLEHCIALKSDGTVWAWGRNFAGMLGDGTTTDRNVPVQVANVSGAAFIDAGLQHNGAVLSDGTVRTWGRNGSGEIGDRTRVGRPTPVQVSGPMSNLIDGSEFFVAQHYRDFLSREPDQSGLQFWTQGIESCGADAGCREVKRIDTSAAFFLSIEFQETGYLVYRTYKAAYGDLPGRPVPLKLSEFAADSQRIGQGVVVNAPGWAELLESNKRLFFEGFVGTARFAAAYPASLTPPQFVDALNANAGQVLSADERAALVGGLTGGTLTRAQVLRAVAEDADTQRQEFNRAFVLMQYFGYLRRDPDAAPEADFAGYNFWLSKLDEFRGDWRAAEMVKAFLSSVEYRGRFGAP